MEKKEYTCIVCPRSCTGILTVFDDGQIKTEGFSCPNGDKYAKEEYTDPRRVLTTTVALKGGQFRLLPVVSSAEISRKLFKGCLEALYQVSVPAPVKEGDVVVPDILGTGVDIIAARSMS